MIFILQTKSQSIYNSALPGRPPKFNLTTDQKLCPQESPTSPDSGISSGSSSDEPNSARKDLGFDLDSKDAIETHFPFPKGKALKTRITFPSPTPSTTDVALSSVPNIITATAAIAVANSVVSRTSKSPSSAASPSVTHHNHQTVTPISAPSSPRSAVIDLNDRKEMIPLRDDEELSDDSSSDEDEEDDVFENNGTDDDEDDIEDCGHNEEMGMEEEELRVKEEKSAVVEMEKTVEEEEESGSGSDNEEGMSLFSK